MSEIKVESNNNIMKKKDKLLVVGTWNVHTWKDEFMRSNFDNIIKSLKQTTVNIIGLQEVHAFIPKSNKISAVNEFCKQLEYKYYSNNIKVMKNTREIGTLLACKYKIIKTFDLVVKHGHRTGELNIIEIPFKNNIIIGVIVMHFYFAGESNRIKEFDILLTDIKKIFNDNKMYRNIPLIFIGDFNALTKNDYTNMEWDTIKKVRKKNNWFEPETKLTDKIKANKYIPFYDSLSLYAKNIKSNKKLKNNGKKKCDNLGELWVNVFNHGETLGTCRFDTRIDYIMVNSEWMKTFDIVEYDHFEHNNASDHKLVRTSWKIKHSS